LSRYPDGPREARRFTEFLHAPHVKGVPFYRPTKTNARLVAEGCGVRTPGLLALYESPAEVRLDPTVDRLVLKPNNFAARRGVFLLRREAGGRYFDLLTRRSWTEQEMRGVLNDLLARAGPGKDPTVLAEEFFVGENGAEEIPYDYKLYTFDGSVEFISQINRNGSVPEVAFFQRNFEPLEDGHVRPQGGLRRGQHRRPRNWEEMLDTAGRISRHLDTPFIRVDLYTNGVESVLGELTPRPGGPYHGTYRLSDLFDAELGAYWRASLHRRGFRAPIVSGLPPVLRKETVRGRLTMVYRLLNRVLGRLRRLFGRRSTMRSSKWL